MRGRRGTMTAHREPWSCWAVSDGRAGIESQALGLAEAVARLAFVKIVNKRIEVKQPWRMLPRALWGDPFAHLSTGGALLRPPYPDLWIGCGRLCVPYTMAVKLRDSHTLTVQIQDPRAPLSRFDLVVPPAHDGLSGDNVFPIIGSPSRVTADIIRQDAETLQPAVASLPRPLAALLIGGPNSAFDMSRKSAMRIARAVRKVARAGGGVMVTASRRTPREAVAMVQKALEGYPHFIWDGSPIHGLANPYFGMLGLADLILVTEDSVNMASEAAMTGTPVHIIALARRPGASALKFDRFHAALANRGASRLFSGRLDDWIYDPLDETARVAAEIVRRLEQRSRARISAA